jgi:hypothetical protein
MTLHRTDNGKYLISAGSIDECVFQVVVVLYMSRVLV